MRSIAITAGALILFVLVGSADAQQRRVDSRYLVSAKAGGVNVVDGDVTVTRGESPRELLIAGDELESGDTVHTGRFGRAEILLNPGSYLRIADGTRVRLTETSVYDLKIDLLAGTIIIEAAALDAALKVVAGHADIEIIKDGIFRFDVAEDGRARVMVRNGELLADSVRVKRGQQVTINEGAPAPLVASFNRKLEDSFDIWSRERAQVLVASNKRLSPRAVAGTVRGFRGTSLWIFNPFSGFYTFLPGYWVDSPYGGTYSFCHPYSRYAWGVPRQYPRDRAPGGGNVGSNPSAGGGGGGGGSVGGSSASRPASPPDMGGGRGRGSDAPVRSSPEGMSPTRPPRNN